MERIWKGGEVALIFAARFKKATRSLSRKTLKAKEKGKEILNGKCRLVIFAARFQKKQQFNSYFASDFFEDQLVLNKIPVRLG